jgi:hypothetical protein
VAIWRWRRWGLHNIIKHKARTLILLCDAVSRVIFLLVFVDVHCAVLNKHLISYTNVSFRFHTARGSVRTIITILLRGQLRREKDNNLLSLSCREYSVLGT